MSEEALAWINELILDAGIPYTYGVWGEEPFALPFWTGEKNEDALEGEDGQYQAELLVVGTGKSLLELERGKEKLRSLDDTRTILENGSGVAVFWGGALHIPTDESTMRRIQVNLLIKEWRI